MVKVEHTEFFKAMSEEQERIKAKHDKKILAAQDKVLKHKGTNLAGKKTEHERTSKTGLKFKAGKGQKSSPMTIEEANKKAEQILGARGMVRGPSENWGPGYRVGVQSPAGFHALARGNSFEEAFGNLIKQYKKAANPAEQSHHVEKMSDEKKSWISKKIAHIKREGKPEQSAPGQAAAIAYSMAGESKKKK